jgi:hypothetical protein
MPKDTVHTYGVSARGSLRSTIESYEDNDGNRFDIAPPLHIIVEGADAEQIAIMQNGLAVRYSSEEMANIGDGNALLGLSLVVGDIAVNGNLERGDVKPLHPDFRDSEAVLEGAPFDALSQPDQ